MSKLKELHKEAIEESKGYVETYFGNEWLVRDSDASSKSAEITKQIAIEFVEWCNFPMYREVRNLGFEKRVTALYPDYNVYIVIDEKGNSIFPKGKFLTTEELFEEFLKQRQ
jgi:hypothetical protein